jgi:hypothetical protein
MENISGNEESVKFDRSGGFWNWNKCVKSIDRGNYVSTFSLSFISDFEVSDLPTEDVEVDELDRHVYYTAKAIRRLTLSKVQSSVSWPPTGSFINELSINIPIFCIIWLPGFWLRTNQIDPFQTYLLKCKSKR